MYTVRQVAERYGVGQHTVLRWIRDGELRAIDVRRTRAARRPGWRISQAAIEAWEQARSATPTQPPTRRRRPKAAAVIEFYPAGASG